MDMDSSSSSATTAAEPFVLTGADYQDCFEKAPLLNFVVDFEGRILHANDFLAELSGFDKTELIRKSVYDLVPPEEHDKVSAQLAMMRHYSQSPGSVRVEPGSASVSKIKLHTKTGDEKTILYSNNRQIIPDREGHPTAFYVAGIDITEWDATLEALKISEFNYRYFFDKSPACNTVIRFDGTIIAVNDAAAAILGTEHVDMMGKNYFDFISPEDREFRRQRVKKIELPSLKTPEKLMIDFGTTNIISSFLTPQGLRSLLFPKSVGIVHEHGKPIAFISSTVDVTELENTRKELSLHRDHLEELVKERTEALRAAQAELVQKERLAALGHLTATVSHELRNPLGTVNSALYVIDKRTKGVVPDIEAAMDRARRNIRRCSDIIEELLDYAREREFSPDPTDIDTWMTSFLDEQPVPDGIIFERRLTATGVTIALDREPFRRCMINLLNNAFQAVGNDLAKRQVHIETRQIEDRIEIEMVDSGCGIDSSHMDRIFEPLFSTKSFGVGLGLPIVQKIVKQHGGDIRIQSEPGKGTAVTLSLPLLKKPEEKIETP